SLQHSRRSRNRVIAALRPYAASATRPLRWTIAQKKHLWPCETGEAAFLSRPPQPRACAQLDDEEAVGDSDHRVCAEFSRLDKPADVRGHHDEALGEPSMRLGEGGNGFVSPWQPAFTAKPGDEAVVLG